MSEIHEMHADFIAVILSEGARPSRRTPENQASPVQPTGILTRCEANALEIAKTSVRFVSFRQPEFRLESGLT